MILFFIKIINFYTFLDMFKRRRHDPPIHRAGLKPKRDPAV